MADEVKVVDESPTRDEIFAMIMTGKSDPAIVKRVTTYSKNKRLVRTVILQDGRIMNF